MILSAEAEKQGVCTRLSGQEQQHHAGSMINIRISYSMSIQWSSD